jgi:uncharacterized protein
MPDETLGGPSAPVSSPTDVAAPAALPVPRPDADSARFWAATLAGRLELPRCRSCDRLVWYPRRRCPRCLGDDLDWEVLSGLGTVYASTVVNRAPSESFESEVPYVVALVDLDEGARLMTNIVGCPPETVAIGMRVTVTFRRVSDEAALPLFAPSSEADRTQADDA